MQIQKPDAKTVLGVFDSIGEFQSAMQGVTRKGGDGGATAFTGYESLDDAKRNLLKGKLEVVPRSEALLDKITGDSIELDQPVWEQSVAGFIPCVPAFLAGSPESMYRPMLVKSDRAPVKVFASVCCSAGLSADELEKRGVAILALCQKLSALRPVELWVFADLGSYDHTAQIPMVKIETSPLDLATATYALSSAAFLRQLCFGWGEQHGFTGAWAWGGAGSDEARLRKCFNANEIDLLIKGGLNSDPLVREPVKWLNEQIGKYIDVVEA